MVWETRGRLTDDLNILASLLVALASAADSIGEAVTLMSEGLTPLTCRSARHQLILKRGDQYAADMKRDRQALTPTYILHPHRLAPVPTHNPMSRVCSTSSAWRTLGTIWRGEGSSASETPTSDSLLLGATGGGRVRGGATMTCLTIPLEAIHVPVSWRAQERSPT